MWRFLILFVGVLVVDVLGLLLWVCVTCVLRLVCVELFVLRLCLCVVVTWWLPFSLRLFVLGLIA